MYDLQKQSLTVIKRLEAFCKVYIPHNNHRTFQWLSVDPKRKKKQPLNDFVTCTGQICFNLKSETVGEISWPIGPPAGMESFESISNVYLLLPLLLLSLARDNNRTISTSLEVIMIFLYLLNRYWNDPEKDYINMSETAPISSS